MREETLSVWCGVESVLLMVALAFIFDGWLSGRLLRVDVFLPVAVNP
jgi:hypothetical protein